MKPTAIGYLRRDISGVREAWDEIRIKTVARRLGYERAKTVVFSAMTADPVDQLIATVRRVSAEAVVVPSLDHLDGVIPEALIKACDVVIVETEETLDRRLATIFDPPASEGDLHADGHSGARDSDRGGRGMPGGQRDLSQIDLHHPSSTDSARGGDMSNIETPGNNGACFAGDADAAPKTLRIDGADDYRKPTQMDELNG